MKNLLANLQQGWVILLVGVLWALTYFFAREVLEATQLVAWQRVGVALLPILPFVGFLYILFLGIRQMDELHLRVQMEALAIAFPLAIVFLMSLGLVGQALELSYERHIWHYLPMCYFVGLAIAWRRYR